MFVSLFFSLRINIIPIGPACALGHCCVSVDIALQDISNPKELLCLKFGSSFEDPVFVYIIEGIT